MTCETRHALLDKLAGRGFLTGEEPGDLAASDRAPATLLERMLAERGVSRHELLACLADIHHLPVVEYDESITGSRELLKRVDAEALKARLWFPISATERSAKVIAWDPADSAMVEEVRKMLGVAEIDFLVALPSDVERIIEHNLDVNPGFMPGSARTPLAKVRTFLAERRSLYACMRTSLARGRTGLAILRTGLSFVTIAMVLYRVFGTGLLNVLEVVLTVAGVALLVEGIRWYLPARRSARQRLAFDREAPANGTTILLASWNEEEVTFARSDAVAGAEELRAGWSNLSGVMRRRFLANDRTDLAEERTFLACLRTKMARARTGLAFTRTGIAFAGLGVALLRMRQFKTGGWPIFDAALILGGVAMTLEGFLWYFLDRHAGAEGRDSVRSASETPSLWSAFFPPHHERPVTDGGVSSLPPVALNHAPGIWGTTGLALERTVLAERRNVMARLRTVMARSRTGLAFVRTGMSICAVGMVLLVYFGTSSVAWAALYAFLVVAGGLLAADGLYWHLPAEKLRRQLPYCFCDVEIAVPDYGKPARSWSKAVFSHDDL